MKFELTRAKWANDYYLLTVNRNELLKHYEKDKAQCLETLNAMIEMFCAPHCFEADISEQDLESIIKGFTTTRKKFGLTVAENEKGLARLEMMYIR
jgi:trimethylamine:corrinoid methyltransferase-like protein